MDMMTRSTEMGAGSRANELRAQAMEHAARAERLREEAKEADRSAWRMRADAALIELAAIERPIRAYRRPRQMGQPWYAINRVIALMERLSIDEHVSTATGLGHPLSLIERRLGISYGGQRIPEVGVRLENCETAVKPDELTVQHAA